MTQITYDQLRRQYRKNADELAGMIASRRYQGMTLEQLTTAQARADRCANMTDAELSITLADCRRRVSTKLAEMLTQ